MSIVTGMVALLLFWRATAPPTYRYKLTVEVETPEGLHRLGGPAIELDQRKATHARG